MHFGFDDEQLAFRQATADLLTKECGPEVVRAAWETEPGQLARGPWDRLADMGVLHTLVSEADGGLGLDERSLVMVLEEAGRAGLPHPLVETAAVAAPLLAATGNLNRGEAAAGADLLSGLISSDLGSPHVTCAADADHLLLRHPRRAELHLVHVAQAPELTFTPSATVDRSRRAAQVEWTPDASTRLTDDPALLDLAFDRGALGAAAQLLGLSQRMLDLTVAYVSERHQFGQPVGAFQAVKHHLADAFKDLSFARPAVYRAAHSVATGAASRARDVSMAKAMASGAADLVGRHALQCHGAIGYTVEADLHLYLKRAWALARAWGDIPFHRDRVASHVLAPDPSAASTSARSTP